MQIETQNDLLKIIEETRVQKEMSERELSLAAGKSPGLYWWVLRRGKSPSFATTIKFLEALGLKMVIK